MNNVKKQEKNNIHNVIPFLPNGEFYFTKGVKSFQKQKFDLAIKWFKKAIELEPKNSLFLCQLSIVYTETGSYHKANDLLQQALTYSNDPDCYYLLANNCAHLGLLDDAMKYSQLYLEKEPDGEFEEEAHALIELIDFELTEDIEDDWLLEAGDDLLKYQETAFQYMENNEWKKALPIIEEMLLLYPEHLLVKHDYAQALFHLGEQEKAIQLEEKILVEKEHTIQSKINLTLFYYLANQKAAYTNMLADIINVYPIHADQQIKLAVTFAKTNNNEEAIRRFKRINPMMARGHVSYYEWFSIAHYRVGNSDKAASTWEEGCIRHRVLRNRDYKRFE